MLSVIPTESILGSHSVWALPSLPWNSPCPPHWSLCLWPCPYNLCISQKTKYLLKLNSAHIPPPVKPMPPHLTRSHITTPPRGPSSPIFTHSVPQTCPRCSSDTPCHSPSGLLPLLFPLPGVLCPPWLSCFCASLLPPCKCYLLRAPLSGHPV